RPVDVEDAQREAANVGQLVGRDVGAAVRQPDLRGVGARGREQAVPRVLGERIEHLDARTQAEVLLAVQRAALAVALGPAALDRDQLLAVALKPRLFVIADILAPAGGRCRHCAHLTPQITPNARPARSKALSMRPMSWVECRAVTSIRMRAWPSGTTG